MVYRIYASNLTFWITNYELLLCISCQLKFCCNSILQTEMYTVLFFTSIECTNNPHNEVPWRVLSDEKYFLDEWRNSMTRLVCLVYTRQWLCLFTLFASLQCFTQAFVRWLTVYKLGFTYQKCYTYVDKKFYRDKSDKQVGLKKQQKQLDFHTNLLVRFISIEKFTYKWPMKYRYYDGYAVIIMSIQSKTSYCHLWVCQYSWYMCFIEKL